MRRLLGEILFVFVSLFIRLSYVMGMRVMSAYVGVGAIWFLVLYT